MVDAAGGDPRRTVPTPDIAARRLTVTGTDRSTLGWVGVALVFGAFGLVAGVAGVAGAAAVAVTWYLLPTVFAVALGQAVLVALGVGTTDLTVLAIVEAPLLWLLVAPVVDRATPLAAPLSVVVPVALFGGLLVAVETLTRSFAVRGGVLVVAFVLVSYLLSRFDTVDIAADDGSSPTDSGSDPDSDGGVGA